MGMDKDSSDKLDGHSFKEPQHNLQYKLAEAYIDRKRIGKKYGIPAVSTICAGLLIWGGVGLGVKINNNIQKSNLNRSKENLETLIKTVRDENIPDEMLKEAESAYNDGMYNANNKNYKESRESEKKLNLIRKEAKKFSTLSEELENTYSYIKTVVKEDEAKNMADSLYREGQNYVKVVKTASLQKTVQELQDLEAILNQECSIKIVNKNGVKSGIDRYFEDADGKRISGYYVIVEALDAKENVIPQIIKSEENGERKKVDLWGERVPQEVYEQVKRDKLDNGIIENDVFGEKERGYLNPKIIFEYNGEKLKRMGQILEW